MSDTATTTPFSPPTTTPIVTHVRATLVKRSRDYLQRSEIYYPRLADPAETPGHVAHLHAHQGQLMASAYQQALAAVLRMVDEDNHDLATDIAEIVNNMLEYGDETLEESNEDVWAVIEAEDLAEAKAVQAKADAAALPGFRGPFGSAGCPDCDGSGLNVGRPSECPTCGAELAEVSA